MGKKSGPPPPDYTSLAEKTQQSAQTAQTQQDWANRPTQVNPWGTVSWDTQKTIDPATGQAVNQWVQTTQLNPQQQAALDSQNQIQQGRSDIANSLLSRVQQEYAPTTDWSQFGAMTQGPQATTTAPTTTGANGAFTYAGPQQQTALNFSGLQDVPGSAQARGTAENAIYQSATSRLDPQWQQQESAMQTRLANQGITPGSTAYAQAMDNLQRQKTDAYQQANLAAITGGGAEAQRNSAMDLALRQQQAQEAQTQGQFGNTAQANIFQQALQGYGQNLAGQAQQFGQGMQANAQNFGQQQTAANTANQLRQAAINEMMQRRAFSLNEINGLLTGQQVNAPNFQNFNTAGNAGGVDYSGAGQAQYQAAQAAQAAQNAGTSQLLSGVGAIGGMAFGLPPQVGGALGGAAGSALSDRAVKTLLRRLGTHPRGFGIWLFRYIGETAPRVGVVAQEVQRVMPEAVRSLRGVLMVDYAML